jgi:hypothetical protein
VEQKTWLHPFPPRSRVVRYITVHAVHDTAETIIIIITITITITITIIITIITITITIIQTKNA